MCDKVAGSSPRQFLHNKKSNRYKSVGLSVVPKAGDSPVRGNVATSYLMGKATKGLPSPAKGLNLGSSTPLFRGVK